MNYKKSDAEISTITRNLKNLTEETGNVYESLTIIMKRANQIALTIKDELEDKLEEFSSYATDNLEEIFENREQIEVSRYYERLPKPVALAYQEWLEGDIYYRQPEEIEQPVEPVK